jgi:hypothetical protein
MSFAIAATAAAVVGGAASYAGASKQADAMDAASRRQMAGFELSKPFVSRMYTNAESYLDDGLQRGNYDGQTLAGFNPYSQQGYEYLGNTGQQMMGQPANFMQTAGNFANNAAGLYDQAQRGQTLNNATAYATNPANYGSLLDAAMRDDTRRLQEQTLPGINQSAMATNNVNSSRAGVADAIASRGYNDRRADVGANIQQQLMDRSIQQQNQDYSNAVSANNNLASIYGNAFGMQGQIGDRMAGAGAQLQSREAAELQDQRSRFEQDRDYGMDQYIKYNAGILNNAQMQSPQNPVTNTVDPTAAAIGGAMSGYGLFGGFNPSSGNAFSGLQSGPTATASGQTYAQQGNGRFVNQRFVNLGGN